MGESDATPPAHIRVVVAEDHPLMLEAILHRLELAGDIDVVGTASTGDGLVSVCLDTQPDVVITDISMEGMSGIEATRALVAKDPAAKIVILSGAEDAGTLADAVAAGAIGFLTKTGVADDLAAMIRRAHRGEPAFDTKSTQALVGVVRRPAGGKSERASELSAREIEVLVLAADGCTNAQIGERLYISPQTVKTHLENIYRKLEVRSRAAAVRIAVDRGLV